MEKALVLGAAGHIGAHIVRVLLAGGYEVRAAYRTPHYRSLLESLPIERVMVDVEQPAVLRRALDGCALVFHCAGYYPSFTEPRAQAVARGIEQIHRVFDVLRAARPERIVYVSSVATIASIPHRPSTEADPEPWPLPHWRSLYATVKIAMEHEVLRYAAEGLPLVIVNPSVCIGEYDAHPFSGKLLLLYATGRLPVYLERALNVVYTGDVAAGCVAAATRGQLGQRYILANENLMMSEWTRRVAQAAGVAPPRWRAPYAMAMAAAMASEGIAALMRREPLLPRRAVQLARHGQRLDSSRARDELGMSQTPVDEAIRRALAWFRAHGYVQKTD